MAHIPGATSEAKGLWRAAVKAIQHLLHRDKIKTQLKTVKFQEDRYLKDFYWFAKSASKGTLEKTPGVVKFGKELADHFYPSTYSNKVTIDKNNLKMVSQG